MTDITNLCRPIVGIENRTAQEAFDIMADRIRAALSRPIDPKAEVEPVGWETPSDRARVLYLARKLWNEDQFSCAWSEENREHYIIRAAMQLVSPSIVAPVGVKPLDIDWKAMYLAARAAQLKTGGSDEYEAGHFADKANQAILSALTSAEKAGVGDGDAERAILSELSKARSEYMLTDQELAARILRALMK